MNYILQVKDTKNVIIIKQLFTPCNNYYVGKQRADMIITKGVVMKMIGFKQKYVIYCTL